jgi:general secretion pathway protein C
MLLSSTPSSARLSPLVARRAGRWWPVVVAFLVWLAVGFSVAYGVLRWLAQTPVAPVPVNVPVVQAVDTRAVARALGSPQNAVPAAVASAPSPRYVLTGVVAPVATGFSSKGEAGSGVALIAIEGQRPSPYRVGAVLDGRWRVQSVERRSVVLQPVLGVGSGGPATTLSLSGAQP